MKKFIINAAMVLGFVSTVFLSSSSVSAATPEQLQLACTDAFQSACLHGGTVDLTNFFTVDQVNAYCAPGATFCSDTECSTRLKVLLGLDGLTYGTTGNVCLPSAPVPPTCVKGKKGKDCKCEKDGKGHKGEKGDKGDKDKDDKKDCKKD